MPRNLRVEYPGAVYHVISRGNRRESIVREEADGVRFLETMDEACARTGWRLHAWVLMPNHYHWLLETPEPNLVRGMQWFQTTYSARFRTRHDLPGHVFQGRYKAILIDPASDHYFEAVSSYIHLNPARARALLAPAADVKEYRWSSYPGYLKPAASRAGWLEVGRVLGSLGLDDSPAGRRAYQQHLQERVAELRGHRGPDARHRMGGEWKHLRRGWCQGDDAFRARMLERIDRLLRGNPRNSLAAGVLADHSERKASELLASGLNALGISEADLGAWRKADPRKQVLAWFIRRQTCVGNAWVSARLHMGHVVTVSQSVHRVERENTPELRRIRRALCAALRINA